MNNKYFILSVCKIKYLFLIVQIKVLKNLIKAKVLWVVMVGTTNTGYNPLDYTLVI